MIIWPVHHINFCKSAIVINMAKLVCRWCHDSRKLLAILLVIQNAFDLKGEPLEQKYNTFSTKINLKTQRDRSCNSRYGLGWRTWTGIQNWNLRNIFSMAWKNFHRNRYEPLVTVAQAPSIANTYTWNMNVQTTSFTVLSNNGWAANSFAIFFHLPVCAEWLKLNYHFYWRHNYLLTVSTNKISDKHFYLNS